MLNEEKVILMTQMASYEENEGKKNMAIGRYFRSDYIAIQVLKSILCATIAYGVCFALFVFYDFENFMQDIYKMDLIGFGKNVLLYYGITVVVYGVASYLICSLLTIIQETPPPQSRQRGYRMIWKNISNGMDLFDSRLHFSFVKAGYQLVSRLQAGSTLHRLPVFQSDAIPSFQQLLRRSVRNAVL